MIDGIDGSELLPIMPFQVAPAAFPEWGRAGVDWVVIWVSSAAPRTLPESPKIGLFSSFFAQNVV